MSRRRRDLYSLWHQLMMLSLESQAVIGLRMLRVAKGGKPASTEARRMLTEKVAAGTVAAATLLTGGGVVKAVKKTRTRVRRNARRLMR
jgi:hypothetical protein